LYAESRERGRGHLLIIVLIVIILFYMYKLHNTKQLDTNTITKENLNIENSQGIENLSIKNEHLAENIKNNFQWMNSDNMKETLNEALGQDLLVPNPYEMGYTYTRDKPNISILSPDPSRNGEALDATVALNNAVNQGTGSIIPLGIDSRYGMFQKAHEGTYTKLL